MERFSDIWVLREHVSQEYEKPLKRNVFISGTNFHDLPLSDQIDYGSDLVYWQVRIRLLKFNRNVCVHEHPVHQIKELFSLFQFLNFKGVREALVQEEFEKEQGRLHFKIAVIFKLHADIIDERCLMVLYTFDFDVNQSNLKSILDVLEAVKRL